jgi:hypothetical protein
MKEKLITFETAKLAKEKGFNWPVNFYWYNNKPNDWHESDNDYLFNENEESDHISRPTQSLLQKWLRDVKGIHLNCLYVRLTSKNVIGYIYGVIELPEADNNEVYIYYEDALEDGLLATLKLIP